MSLERALLGFFPNGPTVEIRRRRIYPFILCAARTIRRLTISTESMPEVTFSALNKQRQTGTAKLGSQTFLISRLRYLKPSSSAQKRHITTYLALIGMLANSALMSR